MDQRSYNQYCATARALDIVAERWTLLLIRCRPRALRAALRVYERSLTQFNPVWH